jgi:DNA-binding CsgD family transcriptional regulator
MTPVIAGDALTGREIEILQMRCAGLGFDEIAEQLFLSRNTVRSHADNIAVKVQSGNPYHLALYAVEHGLVCVTPPAGASCPVIRLQPQTRRRSDRAGDALTGAARVYVVAFDIALRKDTPRPRRAAARAVMKGVSRPWGSVHGPPQKPQFQLTLGDLIRETLHDRLDG